MHHPSRHALAAALTIGISCLASTAPARADVPAKANPFGFIDEGSQRLSAFLGGPTAASEPTAPRPDPTAVAPSPTVRSGGAEKATHGATRETSLLPKPSLVLRDWRGSFVVAGASSVIVDDLRPLASNRTALLRFTAPPVEQRRGITRFAPYAQLGAGEWRIDPVMFPASPTDSALAAQFGAGLELTIAKTLHVAAEAHTNFLYGAQPWSGDVKLPRVSMAFVALEAKF